MGFTGNEMISNQNVNTCFVLDLVKVKKSHILKSMLFFFLINEHKDTEELTRLYLSPTATISGQISGRQGLFLGEGNGTPLQYSCLENPMDGGGW